MLRFAAVVLSASMLAVTSGAQVPIPTGDGTMLATEQYLFVLRGDVVYQLDVHTLQLRRQVRLPAAAPRAAGERETAEKPIAEPAPLVEEIVEGLVEEVEEADAPIPRAGGKYGGRASGNPRAAAVPAAAISRSLAWLAAHQDDDGKWDADGFMKHDATGDPSTGPGMPVHDVGVTGLALLAFLGDGNTMRNGPYKEVVKRGVNWLRQRQDLQSGLFGENNSQDFIYDHAIATLAMVEAYGLSEYRLLRSSAQNALNYLESHRNPYTVWRYQPRDNDNDTSVTAWCVMAYRSGLDFKLDVNRQALRLAEVWFDQMTDPVTGRTGYTERGGFSSRLAGEHASRFPREANEAMTAAALLCRFFLGQDPRSTPVMLQQADLIVKKPPRWEDGQVDEYAWYFGTMAMYQVGGRHWKDWSAALETAIVAHQRGDANFGGSWDPVGVWGERGGRVYSTALQCLTLESYYRYTRLVR